MRTVMIATPCKEGLLDVYYVNSLINTLRLCASQNIFVAPVWFPNEALVNRARNNLFAIAHEMKANDVVWIDDDQEWKAEDFMRLLNHPVDFVGGAVIKKTNAEQYNVKSYTVPIPKDEETGLLIVDGVGTGFLRMSRRAIDLLWDISEAYRDGTEEKRMVFNTRITNGEFQSEDNFVCDLWKSLGEKVYVDPEITCAHVGRNKWTGNFKEFLDKISNTNINIKQKVN